MRTLIFFPLLLVAFTGKAQTTPYPLTSEFYLTIMNPVNLTSWGLQYKSEYKKERYVTLSVANLISGYGESLPKSTGFFSESHFVIHPEIGIGLEKRKNLDDKLMLAYGPTVGGSLDYSWKKTNDPSLPLEDRTSSSLVLHPFIGYSVGLLYPISKNFLLSAYLNPRLALSYNNKTDNSVTYNLDLYVSSEWLAFSIVYRMDKSGGR